MYKVFRGAPNNALIILKSVLPGELRIKGYGSLIDRNEFKDNHDWTCIQVKWKWNGVRDPVILENPSLAASLTQSLVHLNDNKRNELVKTLKNYHYSCLKKDQIVSMLLANKQIVFTGAPGTGKTWKAKEKAFELVVDGYPQESEQYKFHVEFVQFHPSYDYTDFMEGFRPFISKNTYNQSQKNYQLGFQLKNGVFKEFCRKAGVIERILFKFKNEITSIDELRNRVPEFCGLPNKDEVDKKVKETIEEFWKTWIEKNKEKIQVILKELREDRKTRKDLLKELAATLPPFVFIIDEINRAELSKVFGELMYSLEPDYRGEEGKVKTQYANMNTPETWFIDEKDDRFFIPTNVYIIGTMNDIDRSVEIFDFALRRRFAWNKLEVDGVMDYVLGGMLKGTPWENKIEQIKDKAKSLNKEIVKDDWGLNEDYKIGPAYFGKIKEYGDGEDAYKKLWDNHLRLLLFEYKRGTGQEDDFVKDCKKAFLGSGDGKQQTE